jgi:hypothetical protein
MFVRPSALQCWYTSGAHMLIILYILLTIDYCYLISNTLNKLFLLIYIYTRVEFYTSLFMSVNRAEPNFIQI